MDWTKNKITDCAKMMTNDKKDHNHTNKVSTAGQEDPSKQKGMIIFPLFLLFLFSISKFITYKYSKFFISLFCDKLTDEFWGCVIFVMFRNLHLVRSASQSPVFALSFLQLEKQ